MDFVFDNAVNPAGLATELQAAGATVEQITADEGTVWISATGLSAARVEEIVAAHDPEVWEAMPAQEASVEQTLRARAEDALPKLVQGANAIKNGNLFSGLSVNERGYLELLGRVAAAEIRLLLRRLESAD